MVITLLKPDLKKQHYQDLANKFTAIEPPLYMALRASYLKKFYGIQVIDEEVKKEDIIGDVVEIFPTGTHPSAFIPQLDGLKDRVFELSKDKEVRVWNSCPVFEYDDMPLWDLFDMSKYRAHNWHCYGGLERSPYGVLYTSFGCPYNCQFCCVKDYYHHRYYRRDIKHILMDIMFMRERHGIRNIKIIDELFMLKGEQAETLLDGIIGLGYNDLNMWCYTRMDTIDVRLLPKAKKAGIRWLGIGVESGNRDIRRMNNKLDISNSDIIDSFKAVRDAGMYTCPNYIFGFPDDNIGTMNETLDLAMNINSECANLYSMIPYPGTKVRQIAMDNNWELSPNWADYSQFSPSCQPSRTFHLSPLDVLKFRDNAWKQYHTSSKFRAMILNTFGNSTLEEIDEMVSIPLRRKLYEA